jgi:hypothetical protein
MELLMTILPLLLFSIIPLALLGFTIWFAISFLTVQKERNGILKELSKNLDVFVNSKKKE